jgi:4-hydroxy-tetrahydrodipicolinate synthase
MKKFSMQGTFTALITPFKKDGSVDFNAIEKLIDFQIENGIDGIVICGSTGESATLTLKEKQAIIIHSVEYAAGRIQIIIGTGTYETQATMDMTIFAREHGADAVLIVAPYYIKPTQDGLFEHYRLIADQVDIPQIVYNIPGRTGVNILPETMIRIAECSKNIVGVKEASGNLEQMMEIIKDAPSHFSLFSGDDILTLPILAAGGKGVISVISNYLPGKFSEMVKLALKGKIKEAQKIHYEVFEMMKANMLETNPIPVKAAMALLGRTTEVIRLPLLQLKADNKKKMKKVLSEGGLL